MKLASDSGGSALRIAMLGRRRRKDECRGNLANGVPDVFDTELDKELSLAKERHHP